MVQVMVYLQSFTYKHGFALECSGDLISVIEAEIREKEYAKQNTGCFMYYFAGKDRKSLLSACVLRWSCTNFNSFKIDYVLIIFDICFTYI